MNKKLKRIEMKKELIKRIESEINATPTGDLRNLLTDINIFIRSSVIFEDGSLETVAYKLRNKLLGENPLTTISNIDKSTISLLKKLS